MTFLLTWQLHEGKLHDTLAHFARMSEHEEQGLMTDKVRLVGRWHNIVRGSGAAVFESDSIEALTAYAMQWNRFMDLEISPVVDDAGARELGKRLQ